MTTMTKMHSCMSVDWAVKYALEYDGKVSKKLAQMVADGLEYVPACDNTRPDGHCAGHQA